jgi:hypothetical protein
MRFEAQAETMMRKSTIIVNKRRRDEDMKRVLEEREATQKRVLGEQEAILRERGDTVRLMKENVVFREAELRKEMEVLVAASRATSVSITTANAAAGDTGTRDLDGAGGALTDRAFLARSDHGGTCVQYICRCTFCSFLDRCFN